MPLPRPLLDDRSYEQLRDELVRRIPVYNPEWTDHNPSDPGITLIEVFAFLAENLLYRFNQIPETAYLEYLQLLRVPLRPATPARAIIVVATDKLRPGTDPFELVRLGSEAKAGALSFEVRTEVRALPVMGLAVAKAAPPVWPPPPDADPDILAEYERILDAVGGMGADEAPAPYENASVPEKGGGLPVDFARAVDGTLWLAVLNATREEPATVRTAILTDATAPLLLNVAFIPDPAPPLPDEIEACPGQGLASPAPPVEWQISTGRISRDGRPLYMPLRVRADTTHGLTRPGVARLELPGPGPSTHIGLFVPDDPDVAGTGHFPPVLDDETEAKLLFWVRAFRPDGGPFGRVAFVGLNGAEVEQANRARTEFVGVGTGQPEQVFRLVHRPIIDGSLELQVEGASGWATWRQVDDVHAADADDEVYVLDREAGTVRFGNGIQGAMPQIGERLRALTYRYGGGQAGNVAAGAIARLPAHSALKAFNPLPAAGGRDSEAVAEALERIPGELRRRDRTVTRSDFEELALATPDAEVGRAECLPLFKPDAPEDQEVPGAVSVVVWPREDRRNPQAPLPDRTLLAAVCRWLDSRRLVTTELYVLPPVYRRIAVSIGIAVEEGHGIEAVRRWVELVLRQYLAPLPPYGPTGRGWPLGRRIFVPELQAVASQVDGVAYLEGLTLAAWDAAAADWLPPAEEVTLRRNQAPELAVISVLEGDPLPEPGQGLAPLATATPVPIPVPKQVC